MNSRRMERQGQAAGARHDRRRFLKASAGVGVALSCLGAAAHAQAQEGRSTEPAFFEVVRKRRSVRRFKSTPVPDEHLTKILDAARMAPTSGNQQPWKFLVVREQETIDELRHGCMNASMERFLSEKHTLEEVEARRARVVEYYEGLLSAPLYVVVLVDSQSKWSSYNVHDGPLAAGYLLLAARALGYGSLYCTDSIPEPVTREVFQIPARYQRICITPIGVPTEWPESPPKKNLEEFVVHEKFG